MWHSFVTRAKLTIALVTVYDTVYSVVFSV